MRYIDVPAKVIEAAVIAATPLGAWPYPSASDPYWAGGENPQPYRWRVELVVSEQTHSSPRTRKPYAFDGFDINVGDYIADANEGVAVKITSIESKSETSMVCVVEDIVRYNMFRDPSRLGSGIFSYPSTVVVFETNEEGLPVVDPVPASGVGVAFFANLMSRFQNIEESRNFLLHKQDHGFETDDLISADPLSDGFVKTDSAHPFIVGAVSYSDLGPNDFMINPIQKVIDNYDGLMGSVGDVLYVDPLNPGGLATVGTIPVMIKLRDNTKTIVRGVKSDPATEPGYTFTVNGKEITVGGPTAADVATSINEFSNLHGVVATAQQKPTVVDSSEMLGEVYSMVTTPPPSAIINGVTVEFTSNVWASTIPVYGPSYMVSQDIVDDINAANIPNVRAEVKGNLIQITNFAGTGLEIENVSPDSEGRDFAGGVNTISGMDLSTAPSDELILTLEAIDARAINLFDTLGSAMSDMGVVSAENGQKAAALYIEQGIRQAATYVVATITARDAINAMFGDQCFVQDKGNGEWAHYIRTLDDNWVKVADKDSSETDAQTVEIEITHETDVSDVIYTVSGGSRVTFVTVTVTEQFNGLNPLISVGDADDANRLMTNNQNDLKSLGTYSTTPSYIYSGSSDVDITFTFDAANSTTGKAVIAISYT